MWGIILIPYCGLIQCYGYAHKHRRRNIVKVGGAKDMIVREKFQTVPTLGQTAPIFEWSMLQWIDFLHKRTNSKSSRADLAAT